MNNESMRRSFIIVFATLFLSSCFHNKITPTEGEVQTGSVTNTGVTETTGVSDSQTGSNITQNPTAPVVQDPQKTTEATPELNSAPKDPEKPTQPLSTDTVKDFEKELDGLFKQIEDDIK